MKNNKGQALIEFIIILPIFLILIISLVDFGTIFMKKNNLENNLDTIVTMYKEDKINDIKKYAKDNNLDVDIHSDNKFKVIKVSKTLNLTSPATVLVFGKNYKISTKREIYVK